MPLNQPIQKRYFSISEVAKLLDVKPSLLRFWEKEFKQIQPKTNARGKRAYKQEDIDIIRRIYDLVKVQGLTLEGARKALTSRKGRRANAAKRRCWRPKRPTNLRPRRPKTSRPSAPSALPSSSGFARSCSRRARRCRDKVLLHVIVNAVFQRPEGR